MTRIHVLIPSFNCGQWIARTLDSVAKQHHQPASVLVIDDASPDHDYSSAALDLCRSYGYQYLRNGENQKCPYNLWLGMKVLDAQPEDVVFILDGDDFLPYWNIFSKIAAIYEDPGVWLTYGNYAPYPRNTGQTKATPYPPEVIRDGTYRHHTEFVQTRFNHPITFRKHLWDQLTVKDLQKSDGTWFRGGYDLVIMMPLLELASTHHRYLDEELYGYNAVNPLSDSSINVDLVHESREILHRKPKVAL